MSNIRISSKVDAVVWHDLKQLASESQQNISEVLNKAITEYVSNHGMRPIVLNELKNSVQENEQPGQLLSK